VPAFEAFKDLPLFPQNKSMLKILLKEKKVDGYKYVSNSK
jgi:hypothetical protein